MIIINKENIILFIIIILALWKIIDIINTNYNFRSVGYIRILLRQAARYTSAANQDNNLLVALLHANYGAGYLWALMDIASPDDIINIYPELKKYREIILNTQDRITLEMIKRYPELDFMKDLQEIELK